MRFLLLVLACSSVAMGADFDAILSRDHTDMEAYTEDVGIVSVVGGATRSDVTADSDTSATATSIFAASNQADAYYMIEGWALQAQSSSAATGFVALGASTCVAQAAIGSSCYSHVPLLPSGTGTSGRAYGRAKAVSGQHMTADVPAGKNAIIAGTMSIRVTYGELTAGRWGQRDPVFQCEFSGGQYFAAQWDESEDEWIVHSYAVASAADALDGNRRTFSYFPMGATEDLDVEIQFFLLLESGETEVGMYATINDVQNWTAKNFHVEVSAPATPPMTEEIHATVSATVSATVDSITIHDE